MDKILTVKATARELGLSENMLRTWIKCGECPGFYRGNRFYINVDMLERQISKKSRESQKQ